MSASLSRYQTQPTNAKTPSPTNTSTSGGSTVQTKQPTSPPSMAPSTSSQSPTYGLCGSCDDTCAPEKCFSSESKPPELLVLGFVDTTSPSFDCINVRMSKDCELMFQSTTDPNTFVIEKSRCSNLKGNSKLNPNIFLESYGMSNGDA